MDRQKGGRIHRLVNPQTGVDSFALSVRCRAAFNASFSSRCISRLKLEVSWINGWIDRKVEE